MNTRRLSRLLASFLMLLPVMILNVAAHGGNNDGHEEEQLIAGIDNTFLIYLAIFVGLVVVVVVAYIQGTKARQAQMESKPADDSS